MGHNMAVAAITAMKSMAAVSNSSGELIEKSEH